MPAVDVNPNRSAAFIIALFEALAGREARAAFWFYRPVPLPVAAEPLGSATPFSGSGSSLAGDGFLVQLTPANAGTLAAFFAYDVDALSALVHLEVHSGGQLQFRSYDSFEVIILGPALDTRWLGKLIARGIVQAA